MLTQQEQARYTRHFSLEHVGTEGQQKLKNSSVLCIGAGGLGSPAALYLAAAGVGRIGIVDPDTVELSNLQRQLLHGQSTLGSSKLDSAETRLNDVNPHVRIEKHPHHFTAANAREIASRYDTIIDGTDNFPTRYLSNDIAYFLRKPNIYASISQFEGQLTVFAPHLGGPCYRCMLPQPPAPGSVPSCAEAGVLGVLPGIIGSLQAMEAIKLILNIGTPPLGHLLHYDALQTRFRTITLRKDPQCPLCGENPTLTTLTDIPHHHTCASTTPPNPDATPTDEITTTELREKLSSGFSGLLLDVREPWEHSQCNIPAARLIPMGEIPAALPDLAAHGKDREILCFCRSGARSARVMEFLKQQGFTNVKNVTGGMIDWQTLPTTNHDH